MVWIERSRGTANSTRSVGAIQAATTVASRKINGVATVVTNRDIKFCAKVWMTGHSYSHTPSLSVTITRVERERHDTFRGDIHHISSDREVLPHYGPMAFAFSL